MVAEKLDVTVVIPWPATLGTFSAFREAVKLGQVHTSACLTVECRVINFAVLSFLHILKRLRSLLRFVQLVVEMSAEWNNRLQRRVRFR